MTAEISKRFISASDSHALTLNLLENHDITEVVDSGFEKLPCNQDGQLP
jgi:hypothetical protein